jgi:hypothetical protein
MPACNTALTLGSEASNLIQRDHHDVFVGVPALSLLM